MLKNKSLRNIVLIGLLIYSVHISGYSFAYFFQDKTASNYGGFSLLSAKGDLGYTTDMALYTRAIQDTHENGYSFFQRDPYVFENSHQYFPSGNLIYILVSILFVFSNNGNFLFFIGPAVSIFLSLWLLNKILVLQQTEDLYQKNLLLFGFVSGLMFLTSYGEFLNLKNLSFYISEVNFLPRNLGYIGRFPHIEFSIFLLLLWYYCLIRYFKVRGSRDALILGASLAVLQYSYFYFWTSALLFTGIILILKMDEYKTLFKNLSIVFGVYAILCLPFWIKFLKFKAQVFSSEYLIRLGSFFEKGLTVDIGVLIAFLAFLVFDIIYCLNKYKSCSTVEKIKNIISESSFQVALASTIIFLRNIQFLAGYTIQSYHWLKAFYYPVLILVGINYLIKVLEWIGHKERARFYARGIIAAFIFLIFSSALINNFYYGKRWSRYFMFTQSEYDLIKYVKNEIPEKSVLMSNSFNLMAALSANTNNYSLIPNAFLSMSSDDEILRRFVEGFHKLGYRKEEIKSELKKGERYLPLYRYNIRRLKDDTPTLDSATLPDNYFSLRYIGVGTYYDLDQRNFIFSKVLDRKIDEIYEDVKHGDLEFRLDYLIVYKKILPENANIGQCCQTIFENTDFVVLK